MFKNALVSVSNKTDLDQFLKTFPDLRIVSSGGTAQYLEKKGLPVIRVSEQTGFPEVMEGRVKTLHPYVHIPVLQRSWVKEDQEILEQYDLQAFDLVVVNLYPFKKRLKQDLELREMMEWIDVGGPSLLRAAAKNFENVTVICDPDDYSWVSKKEKIDQEDRKKLAAKVFHHLSEYDQSVGSYLDGSASFTIHGNLHKNLRYGENPQQKARWYQKDSSGLHRAEILQGKALSYNNVLDLEAAVQMLRLLDQAAAVSVKHNNPCGVGRAENIEEALRFSLAADPVSVFGGVVALNREVSGDCARQLTQLFLEAVVAPKISEEARSILKEKKNLRVLVWQDLLEVDSDNRSMFRSLDGGFLVQSEDRVDFDASRWKTVSGQLTEEDQKGLSFAWRVCSLLKSNGIAVTSINQSLGLAMGQVNRVDAVKQALEQAKNFHPAEKTLYLASDAFFPFPDSVELAVQAGVKAIAQPGGSIKDDQVIARAKESGIPMVFTGRRHFRH